MRRWNAPAVFAATALAIGVLSLLQACRGAAKPESSDSQRLISVRWIPDESDARKAAVEVSGLSSSVVSRIEGGNWQLADWQQLLPVYTGRIEAGESQLPPQVPPMLGSYSVQSGALRFESQFPLEPGLTYTAVFRPERLPQEGGSTQHLTASYTAPASASTPTTVVSQIYPTADSLPENLLKFYVHFSAPMSRGNIYEHIKLRESTGREIELPFLEVDEELWDPAMTRLTLFIDPGRIKRGVRPLEDIGPALENGKSYSLEISKYWLDGKGSPLREAFQKRFNAAPPDRDPPDPARWKVQAPAASTEALQVTFDEPMDHALALRIRVTGNTGQFVEGNAELSNNERLWTFTPSAPWRIGSHNIVIEPTIEDLAGNNPGKPFDVDVSKAPARRISTTPLKLTFQVR
ncbi:MAG TPA: Ig-like domain-containing protein [Blastocatellia bacterium]|nr:Ig-like domain-containing protein [Blastocatellia bacterium]